MEAISYGIVYVARVAMGGNDTHTVKAFLEAEAYDGPSLIIAYSHCIAHGYDMSQGMAQQKAAVLSGYWPLMRYNPELRAGREESVSARFPSAQYSIQAIRVSGSPLHDAGAKQSGGRPRIAPPCPGGCSPAVGCLLKPRRHARNGGGPSGDSQEPAMSSQKHLRGIRKKEKSDD